VVVLTSVFQWTGPVVHYAASNLKTDHQENQGLQKIFYKYAQNSKVSNSSLPMVL
jgi:hypothetical protein